MSRALDLPDPAAYLRRLADPALPAHIAAQTGFDPSSFERLLANAIGDVTPALQLIAGELRTGQRVLEIGAGLGLAAAFLQAAEVAITPLEPGDAGFTLSRQVGDAVTDWLGAGGLPWLRIQASDLTPARHGPYDLIYSVNVLEHIEDLDAAFAAMAGVLAPGGVMVHSCPNYAVPYEPHFSMPLIPFRPRATERLRPGLAADPVWRSLNFVTSRRVRRMARQAGLSIAFRRGTLAAAFQRLEADSLFRARHGGPVRWLARIAGARPLRRLVEAMPPGLATPMIFTCRHPGC